MKLALVRTAETTIPRARGQFEPREHRAAPTYLTDLPLSRPEPRLVDDPLKLGTTLSDGSIPLDLGHFDQIGRFSHPQRIATIRCLARAHGSPRRCALDSSVRFIQILGLFINSGVCPNIDAPAGKARCEPSILAFLANCKGELIIGNRHPGSTSGQIDNDH